MSRAATPFSRLESLRYLYLRRVVGTALGAAGIERSLRLTTALARGYWDLNPPGRRIAEQRLALAFGDGLPAAQRDAIVRTMYEHVARFWVEAVFLPRLLRPSTWRRRVALSDAGALPALAAAQRGCVVATAYFGNIAVAAFALGELFRPVHVVVDYLADPSARSWQEQLYRIGHVRPLPIDDATRRMPEILRGGGAVMLVVEHRRKRGGGVAAEFLGERGTFQPTPGRLAEWFDVPVVPVLCRRRPGAFGFELWSGRLAGGPDAGATTADVLTQLDRQIRLWPEQYLWNVAAPGPIESGDLPG